MSLTPAHADSTHHIHSFMLFDAHGTFMAISALPLLLDHGYGILCRLNIDNMTL